jgi:hypothetical protein
LLLNRFIVTAIILFPLFIFNCGDSQEKKNNKAPLKDYKDPAAQLKEAKNILGNDAKLTFLGFFNDDKQEEIIAGLEINTKEEWGIKFAVMDISQEKPVKAYETKLLDGSLTDGHLDKIKLPSLKYEMLYYNSGDYFLGSGGGEVFSYIVDYKNKEVYYSHLVVGSKKTSLYLSENIKNDDIRKFLLNALKKDFPALVLVSQDIEFDD